MKTACSQVTWLTVAQSDLKQNAILKILVAGCPGITNIANLQRGYIDATLIVSCIAGCVCLTLAMVSLC